MVHISLWVFSTDGMYHVWLEFWACSYVQFYLGRSVLVCVRVCGSPVRGVHVCV